MRASTLTKVVFCLVIFFPLQHARAEDFYLAQATSGKGSGAACSNALPLTWLNDASNWGTGAGKISPGDTVHLCGTISTGITVQGSGSAGQPITIYFERNAKMSAPIFPSVWWGGGAIGIYRKDYITIDGGENGIIENTDNGTTLGHHEGSNGIGATASNYLTVQNLTIQNLYQRTSDSDSFGAGVGVSDECGAGPTLTGFKVLHNVIHDAVNAISADYGANVTNIEWAYNTISRVNWGMRIGDRGPGQCASKIYIHDNTVHSFRNWNDPVNNAFHHNAFYGWAESGGTLSEVYVYNNRIGPGFGGQYQTSGIFFSGNIGGAWVFNNLFMEGDRNDAPANGLITLGSRIPATFHVYNNTFPGKGAGIGVMLGGSAAGKALVYNVKNNLFQNINAGISLFYNANPATLNSDYNVFFGLVPDDQFSISPTGTSQFMKFSGWQARGLDVHSAYQDPKLDNELRPLQGSPAIDKGIVPGTQFTTDIEGTTRPQGSAWDIGAFEYLQETISPKNPSNLRLGQ